MKILFSHGGSIKLFQIEKGNPKNYENMRKFVIDNLPKIPQNFVVKYKDEEGDLLVIGCNKDLEYLQNTKETDYVRASIEDPDKADEDSDVSDEDSNEGEQKNGENEQSRLHSEAGTLKEENYFQDRQILNESLKNPRNQDEQGQPERILGENPVVSVETKHQKPIVKEAEKTIKVHYEKTQKKESVVPTPVPPVLPAQKGEQESIFSKKEPSKPSPIELSDPIEQIDPQQDSEKPKIKMTQSLLRSKIVGTISERNIQRVVRTLFNQELEQRLDALIPKLMEKLQKQVKSLFPTLIPSEPESELPQNSREEQPSSEHQIVKTIHETPCTGCTKQKIEGIRYKCLQCEENFCQECQKVISHHHNLLKMKFLQLKEEKIQKIIDPKVVFINKCFYLCSFFGGDAKDYAKFVDKNAEMTENELFEEYLSKYGKKLKKRTGERLNEIKKKLGMYFQDDQLEYVDVVISNPLESFENLVEYIKQYGRGSEGQQPLEESFSQLSSKSSARGKSYKKDFPYSSDKKMLSTKSSEEREEFRYFVCAKYQISPQKEPSKARYIDDYYNKNEELGLEEIKRKFCQDMERSNRQDWKSEESQRQTV